MTYAELSALITSYLENNETTFAANIPAFVKLAEKSIYLALKLPMVRKNQIGNATANNRYLSMPSAMIQIFDIQVISTGTYINLLQKDEAFIREAYPDPTVTGVPKFYSIFDHNTVLLGPTPSTAIAVEISYWTYPASIVDVSTNWLGDHLDRALLYGSLFEGYTMMKGDEDLIALYKTEFQDELAKANNTAVVQAYVGDEYRKAS